MGNNLEFEIQEAAVAMTIAFPLPLHCISSSLAYGLCSISMHALKRNERIFGDSKLRNFVRLHVLGHHLPHISNSRTTAPIQWSSRTHSTDVLLALQQAAKKDAYRPIVRVPHGRSS